MTNILHDNSNVYIPAINDLLNTESYRSSVSSDLSRFAPFCLNLHVHFRCMSSPVRLSVCLRRRLKFSAMFLRHLVHWPSATFR